MTKRTTVDPELKNRALQRVEEIGAAAAARELGIPAGTLRAWKTRSKPASAPAGPPAGAGTSDWRAAREEAARDVASAVREAIRQVRRELRADKSHRAQNAAITAGVLLDKLNALEQQLADMDERQVRIEEQKAEILAEVVRAFFTAVGIPLTTPAAAVLRELLLQAGTGAPLVASPALAEPAREDVRERVARELRPRIREELRAEVRRAVEEELHANAELVAATRGLPAPAASDEPQSEAEPMAPGDESGAEVVDGVATQYTDEVPDHFVRAYKNPVMARDAWEHAKRVDRWQERKAAEREFGFHAAPSRWRGGPMASEPAGGPWP
jgi:transposase-like protein